MKQTRSLHLRPIIPEFVEEIEKNKMPTGLDDEIFFRDDFRTGKRRQVFKVPIELLRFRKDNGRIASDVASYEASRGLLYEETDLGQSILRGFLARKDREKTAELKSSILQVGQREVAVITADGFLINGNRRKMVLESILKADPGNDRFRYLRVVILPGLNDREIPPSVKEIEQVENRYQLQQLGKAEYYNFDKAISIKRKIQNGMTLEEQLKDDPNFADLGHSAFKREMRTFENEFLKPLECVDRYLAFFERVGHYNTISAGRTDSRGRWQAFLDYYNSTYKRIADKNQRKKLDIKASEVAYIEDVAFKIIRQREVKDVNKKVHQIMRDLPKLISHQISRKYLYRLKGKKRFQLSKEELVDERGEPLDETTKDIIWSAKFSEVIQSSVVKAYSALEAKKVEDTPLNLLESALKKLNSDQLDFFSLKQSRIQEAKELIAKIRARIGQLQRQIQSKEESK